MRSFTKEGVPGGTYNPADFSSPQQAIDLTCVNWVRPHEVSEEQRVLSFLHKLLVVELIYPSTVAAEIIKEK